jgi:hypothetical protein
LKRIINYEVDIQGSNEIKTIIKLKIMNHKKLFFVISLVFFFCSSMIAQDFEYIGSAKCKMCHNKTTTGAQYKIWAAGPHANAMASLSSEKSLAYAKENGIADPTKEASCIKCHSTFGGINQDLNAGVKATEGVSCETCHGPGSKYKSNTIMKDPAKSLAAGLLSPDENTCKGCHNEDNPFHKEFNYEESLKKIAHPIPAAE